MQRALPTAMAAAVTGVGGATLWRNWQHRIVEKQQDASVEANLPSLHEAQSTPVIRLPKVLTDEDIRSLHDFHTSLVQLEATATGRVRSAAAYKTGAAIEPELEIGWRITYLNAGGAFARALPHLREKIIAAAVRADATLDVLRNTTHPVVPRCVEYHRVVPPGSLPQPYHNDEGSVLTCDLMLSNPGEDFTGGEFCTMEPDGHLVKHRFERGDCLVFVSHKPHCVSAVTSGERRVLVCELWEGIERECAHRCERHWSRCDG